MNVRISAITESELVNNARIAVEQINELSSSEDIKRKNVAEVTINFIGSEVSCIIQEASELDFAFNQLFALLEEGFQKNKQKVLKK